MDDFHGYELVGFAIVTPKAILSTPILSGDCAAELETLRKEQTEVHAKEIIMIKTAPVGTRFNMANTNGWYIQVRTSKKGVRVYRCHIIGGPYIWIDDSKIN